MNEPDFRSASLVNLAKVRAFRVGDVDVQPPTRQVVRNGRSRTLEPRVMQVLVALAEANGAVVSRDELIQRCWGGRIVGENAIHRAISRLREVGRELQTQAFEIEAISKVGYRLNSGDVVDQNSTTDSMPAFERAGAGRSNAVMAVIAVVALTAAIAAWSLQRPRSDSIGVSGTLNRLVPALAANLSKSLSERGQPIAFRTDKERGDADFFLDAERAGGTRQPELQITLRNREGELIWSTTQNSRSADLAKRTETSVGYALGCAKRLVGNLASADPTTQRLAFSTCDQMSAEPTAALAASLLALANRHKRSAPLWLELAYTEASLAADEPAMSPEQAAYRKAADDHSRRAAQIDPNLPDVAAVQSMLLAGPEWRRKLDLELQALANPTAAGLVHQVNSRTTQSVGYTSSAVRSARRAVALEPYSPVARSNLIMVLAHAGFVKSAAVELDRAKAIWPDNRAIADAALRFEFRYGNPATLLGDEQLMEKVSEGSTELRNGPIGSFLNARADRNRQSQDRAIETARLLWKRFGGLPHMYLQTLAEFGRTDEVFHVLDEPQALAAVRREPYILFRPVFRTVRADPRFVGLADRLGLLDVWSESGWWPDFCADPDLAYDCQAEARKRVNARSRPRNP